MTWFKVDDSFYDHPKVFDAPDCAVALWTRAGTWAARNLTDGFVPSGMPARFCDDPERAIRELISRGLWKRTKGGYLFHDWAEYQPMRSDAIAEHVKKATGGTLGNHRRWHEKKGIISPDCAHCQQKPDRTPHRYTDRYSESESESTRPDPTRPDKSSGTATQQTRSSRAAHGEPPPNAGPPGRAEALLTDWRSQQRRPVGSIVAAVGMWIRDAIRDEATDDEIRETLRRWDAKHDKGPGLLPSIFHDVANRSALSNVVALHGQRQMTPGEANVAGWLSIQMPIEEGYA